MQQVKQIFKAILWPILFCIGQFVIILLLTVFFNFKEMKYLENSYPNLSSDEIVTLFQTKMETPAYQNDLAYFLRENAWIAAIVGTLIFLPIAYHYFKKNKSSLSFRFSFKTGITVVLFGISFALLFNITVFQCNQLIPFTNLFSADHRSLWVSIITSGLLGPVVEEILYRGIVYGKLKKTVRPMMAMVLTSVIFGLVHMNPIQMIYGFLISFLLIYVYEKYQTISAPIFLHMGANLSVTLLLPLIIQNHWWFNYTLLGISFFILVVLYFKVIRKDHQKVVIQEN